MSFWTDPGDPFTPFAEPKRPYRFMVYIENFKGGLNATRGSGLPDYLWYAVSCDKPSFNIEVSQHKMINKTFKYPKTVTWEDVVITMVDTDCPSLVELIGRYLEDAGGPAGFGLDYAVPISSRRAESGGVKNAINTTLTKVAGINALGKVKIWQLDPDGRPLEEWQLHDAFISSARFGKLDYNNSDFMNVEITLTYDWATCAVGGTPSPGTTLNSEINGGSRFSWWTSADVGKMTDTNKDTPSLSHLPNRNIYKQTDVNGDGRPDILEDYIDAITESANTEE